MSSVYIWSYSKCIVQRLIASHIYIYICMKVNWSLSLPASVVFFWRRIKEIKQHGSNNTCVYSCRQRIRRLPAVVVSPEEGLTHWRDELCVQGRLLGDEGEAGLEHVSWHLLTQELTPEHCWPHRTGTCSAPGPQAARHNWLMSTMWTLWAWECVVSHTLRRNCTSKCALLILFCVLFFILGRTTGRSLRSPFWHYTEAAVS